jgi:hypothetical protein
MFHYQGKWNWLSSMLFGPVMGWMEFIIQFATFQPTEIEKLKQWQTAFQIFLILNIDVHIKFYWDEVSQNCLFCLSKFHSGSKNWFSNYGIYMVWKNNGQNVAAKKLNLGNWTKKLNENIRLMLKTLVFEDPWSFPQQTQIVHKFQRVTQKTAWLMDFDMGEFITLARRSQVSGPNVLLVSTPSTV